MIHSERLASFIAFAETLNFTRAAERVHISQPSLFAQIKKLETELGTALYRKVGRSLVLSASGEQLLAHARDVARRDAALRAAMSGRAADAPLVLAAGEGTLNYLLAPALRRLSTGKGQRLRVLNRNAAETVRCVLRGEAAVGVTVYTGEQPALSSKRLGLVGLCGVMPKTHPLARSRILSVEALAGVPLVTASAGFPFRGYLETLFANSDCALNVAVEASGWGSMMHLASLGLGLAVVNDFCAPPKGCVARPLRGVAKLEYRLFWRGDDDSADTELLRRTIAESVRA
jgi:DNA-binding transcriptional LysR family regulator